MSNDYRYVVTWPKNMRAKAAREGKCLIAIGIDTPSSRCEFSGPCAQIVADVLFDVGIRFHHGMSLDAAIEEVKGGLTEKGRAELEAWGKAEVQPETHTEKSKHA